MMRRFMIVLSLMVVVLLRCSAALALGAPMLAPRELAPRKVLKDLQTGWCRSNFLASNLAGGTLRITGLDGGILPGDGDDKNNYLVEVDLKQKTDLADGENYKMTLWNSKMLKLKDQAFYSTNKNDTFFLFGGRTLGGAPNDDGIWEYSTGSKQWSRQETGVRPVRVGYGAHINVPEVQAGFWIGGARNRDTSPEIQDSTYFFPIGLTVFNTTTREIRNITAMPMGPTQYGGLVHVPSNHGGMGVLVYMGGERPTNPENVREEKKYDFTVASWKTVWVYDIDKEQWYEQETTGDVPEPRTQFCAVTAKDAGSEDGSHHIYVLGGANFKSKAMADGVYTLAVPSFKWFKAGEIAESRMSHRCEIQGPQVVVIGGRRKFADGVEEGCFREPAQVWDLEAQKGSLTFEPSKTQYKSPSYIQEDVKANPKPAKWADPALEALFSPPAENENDKDGKGSGNDSSSGGSSNASTPQGTTKSPGISQGIIIAIVVISVVVALGIIGLCLFLRRRRQKQRNASAAVNGRSARKWKASRGAVGDDDTEPSLGWGNKHELPQDGSRDGVPIRPELAGSYGPEETQTQVVQQQYNPNPFQAPIEMDGGRTRPRYEMYAGANKAPAEMWAGEPTPKLQQGPNI